MIKKLIFGITIVLAALGLASCNSGGTETPTYPAVYTDFVTYEGNGTGGSTFTFRKEGSSPLITLVSSSNLAAVDFKSGTRIIIQYYPENGQHYVSGPIKLIAAANVEGGGEPVEQLTSFETRNWASEAINVSTLLRSGEYLNVQFTGALGSQSAIVRMVADKSTLDSDYPELHLLYGPYTEVASNLYFFNCSWSIADIWERDTCKGIKVLYKNGGGALGGSVTIEKEVGGFIRPTDQAL